MNKRNDLTPLDAMAPDPCAMPQPDINCGAPPEDDAPC